MRAVEEPIARAHLTVESGADLEAGLRLIGHAVALARTQAGG